MEAPAGLALRLLSAGSVHLFSSACYPFAFSVTGVAALCLYGLWTLLKSQVDSTAKQILLLDNTASFQFHVLPETCDF